MKFNQTLQTFVERDLDARCTPMLLGEPGIGKSSWVRALAASRHTKAFIVPCNQLADKADLTGARLIPVTDENGNVKTHKQFFYPHAEIADAIAYAEANPRETPILFLDELNRSTPDITSAALSLTTDRKLGSVELPNNLLIIAAGNDKGHVTMLDEASINRFSLYKVEPDTQTFLGLDPELNVFVKNVLTAHPEALFCKESRKIVDNSSQNDDDDTPVDIELILDDGDEMHQFSSPRSIAGVSRWLNSFSNQELMAFIAESEIVDGETVTVLQTAIEAHVGKTDFARLLYNEIITNCMSTNNQQNAMTVGKPQSFDKLRAATDRTTLNDLAANMVDAERSACLLYALYDRTDNDAIITALSPLVENFTPGDARLFMSMALSENYDHDNVSAWIATGSELAQSMQRALNI